MDQHLAVEMAEQKVVLMVAEGSDSPFRRGDGKSFQVPVLGRAQVPLFRLSIELLVGLGFLLWISASAVMMGLALVAYFKFR